MAMQGRNTEVKVEPARAAVDKARAYVNKVAAHTWSTVVQMLHQSPTARSTLYHFPDMDSVVWKADGCAPGWWLVRDGSRMAHLRLSGTEFVFLLCLSYTALLSFVPCLSL